MRTDHILQFNERVSNLRLDTMNLIAQKLEEINRLRQLVQHLDLMSSTEKMLADTTLPQAETAIELVTVDGPFDPSIMPAFLRRLDEEGEK